MRQVAGVTVTLSGGRARLLVVGFPGPLDLYFDTTDAMNILMAFRSETRRPLTALTWANTLQVRLSVRLSVCLSHGPIPFRCACPSAYLSVCTWASTSQVRLQAHATAALVAAVAAAIAALSPSPSLHRHHHHRCTVTIATSATITVTLLPQPGPQALPSEAQQCW